MTRLYVDVGIFYIFARMAKGSKCGNEHENSACVCVCVLLLFLGIHHYPANKRRSCWPPQRPASIKVDLCGKLWMPEIVEI